jgi:hypothetical protein
MFFEIRILSRELTIRRLNANSSVGFFRPADRARRRRRLWRASKYVSHKEAKQQVNQKSPPLRKALWRGKVSI